jgi:hypothetical protein
MIHEDTSARSWDAVAGDWVAQADYERLPESPAPFAHASRSVAMFAV